MEVNCWHKASTDLLHGKSPLVAIGEEDGWDPMVPIGEEDGWDPKVLWLCGGNEEEIFLHFWN